MCSKDRPLKTQKLILEIDVTGDESDFARCEQLGEAFISLITQMWWLAAPNIQFTCSAKVKMMPQRVKKTHNNVQLPQVKRLVRKLQRQTVQSFEAKL